MCVEALDDYSLRKERAESSGELLSVEKLDLEYRCKSTEQDILVSSSTQAVNVVLYFDGDQ